MRARWPSGLFVMRKLSPPGWIATSRVSFEMSTPTLCAIVDLISFSVLVLSRGHDPRVSVQAAGKREGWSNYRSVLSDWRAHDPSPPAAGLSRKKASGARSWIRRENDKTRRAFRPKFDVHRRDRQCPVHVDCVEKLRLISVRCADSFCWGAGDSADDGRAAGDAGGAVLRLQPWAACPPQTPASQGRPVRRPFGGSNA